MKYVTGNNTFRKFDDMAPNMIPWPLRYTLEVYVNNFMAIVTPTSKKQMLHVTNATMQSIHDCLPADDNDDSDPILLSKI